MAKPTVHSAGDNSSGENPRVTSKFDRMQGHPRTPGKVGEPGGTTEPGAGHSGGVSLDRHSDYDPGLNHNRTGPSKIQHHEHGTQHTYHHDHPAMSGLHHGAKAKHPFHDGTQGAYEDEHEYHGRGPMDAK